MKLNVINYDIFEIYLYQDEMNNRLLDIHIHIRIQLIRMLILLDMVLLYSFGLLYICYKI